MSEKIKNVFISHIDEDDKGLSDLKDLLGKKGLSVRDYSIHSGKPNDANNPEYIKNKILKPRIDSCGAMIVYISKHTKDSEWVNWEIEYAEKQGMTIIGVWALGENGCEIPKALDDYADAIVGWRGDRIIDALNGEIKGWENPDGTPCSERDITRIRCQ